MSEIHYLGPIGSYSYEVAQQFAIKNQLHKVEYIGFETISAIFQSTNQKNNKAETYYIVPLENSTSGDVYETYKNLFKTMVTIVDSLILDIEHVLLAKKGTKLATIETVYSHPQALMQVSQFTTKNNWQTVPYFSTAEAVRYVSETSEKNVAAVASSHTAALFPEIEIVSTAISNNEENFTRFLVFATNCSNNCEIANKTIADKYYFSIQNVQATKQQQQAFILFELGTDKAGILTEVLKIISQANINMNHITSRPIEGKKFQYFFIVEAILDTAFEVEKHQVIFEALMKATTYLQYHIY